MGFGLRCVAAVTTALCAVAPAMADRETTESLPLDVPDSVSCGSSNRGALSDAVALPPEGPGYIIPDPWLSRGYSFGTRELVSLIRRAAAAVEREHPGGILGVADLSSEEGGALPGHRSHQSGRDVDIIYYALTGDGSSFTPDQHMAFYRANGQANYATAPDFVKGIPVRYFDLARNWSLVKGLILDTRVNVDRIFVSSRVRRWLLRYAEERGESADLIKSARLVLKNPKSTSDHNDHMHVRIGCSDDDITLGRCREELARRRRHRKWRRHVSCPLPALADAIEQP